MVTAKSKDEKAEEQIAKESADKTIADVERESRVMSVEEETPIPEFNMVPPEVYRTRAMARIKAEAAASKIDETVEGGRYKVGDKWFNAHGEEIK